MTFKGPIEEDEFRPIRILEEQLGDHEDEEYEENRKGHGSRRRLTWPTSKTVSTTSVLRYSYLRLTGDGVKVNWDQDDKTFKLSETYGL
ncbi:hypothetical protein KCU95_g7804, partial [Aureobasidium melanogenum]